MNRQAVHGWLTAASLEVPADMLNRALSMAITR